MKFTPKNIATVAVIAVAVNVAMSRFGGSITAKATG